MVFKLSIQVIVLVVLCCSLAAAELVQWEYPSFDFYPTRYEEDESEEVRPAVQPTKESEQPGHHHLQERNRQSGTRRNTIITELESMCSGKSYTLDFNDMEYDYKPSFLQGYKCADTPAGMGGSRQGSCPTNNCISQAVEYQIVRKRKNSGCWEPYSIAINVTCECMASHNTHMRAKKPFYNVLEKLQQQQARLNELGNLV